MPVAAVADVVVGSVVADAVVPAVAADVIGGAVVDAGVGAVADAGIGAVADAGIGAVADTAVGAAADTGLSSGIGGSIGADSVGYGGSNLGSGFGLDGSLGSSTYGSVGDSSLGVGFGGGDGLTSALVDSAASSGGFSVSDLLGPNFDFSRLAAKAAMSGAKTLISGGNIGDAFKGALMGGVGDLAGGAISNALTDSLGSTTANIIGNAGSSIVRGASPVEGIISGVTGAMQSSAPSQTVMSSTRQDMQDAQAAIQQSKNEIIQSRSDAADARSMARQYPDNVDLQQDATDAESKASAAAAKNAQNSANNPVTPASMPSQFAKYLTDNAGSLSGMMFGNSQQGARPRPQPVQAPRAQYADAGTKPYQYTLHSQSLNSAMSNQGSKQKILGDITPGENMSQYAAGGRVVGLGGLAHGGEAAKFHPEAPKGHHPEFISGASDQYARGRGTGQSDDIPAMLRDGDYVMDADIVSALGDGSSKAGASALAHMKKALGGAYKASGRLIPAKIADGEVVLSGSTVRAIGNGDNRLGAVTLDKMREEIRAHKRAAAVTKIPPKAKSPLEYIQMAQKG